jgi:hypothetical protein
MNKIDYPQILADWSGREADLRRIVRYHIYRPMFYRSNLFTHSKRVLWLLQSVLPLAESVFGEKFDTTKAQLMAVVHDDLEIVLGDIMAGHKIKMSPAQLAEVVRQEQTAIDEIAQRYPTTILGYNYRDLLIEGQEQKTLESKLLKYADRFDAFGEALHEVYAGNRGFTTPSVHAEFGVIDLPVKFSLNWLGPFVQNNPEFSELFARSHPLFWVPLEFDIPGTAKQGAPHTQNSIIKNSGYGPYDFWKKIILDSGDSEEIENLFTQKEF